MRGTPRAKISVWRVAEAMVDFAKPQHETLEERLRGLGMHIMFVCTGNICRSPMGELLMTHYLNGTTVQVSSAGTRGLPMHPIDPLRKAAAQGNRHVGASRRTIHVPA